MAEIRIWKAIAHMEASMNSNPHVDAGARLDQGKPMAGLLLALKLTAMENEGQA